MSATMEKARALRLQRLTSMLENRLENPSAALEALISELSAGDPQSALWEALHAAAIRDGMEQDLAAGYVKITNTRRLRPLEPRAQADVLVHAADFHQGVLGDAESAEGFLERVQHVVPGHAEAFARLERRLETLTDARRLVGLYAVVASAHPKSADDLTSKIVNKIVPLPATSPLPADVCARLVTLAPTHPILLGVLDKHCRKTKRFDLACALIEQALADPKLPNATAVEWRRHVIELYTGEAGKPALAIPHVEELLDQNPLDDTARGAAERLLSNHDVAARAAAALQKARRLSRAPK